MTSRPKRSRLAEPSLDALVRLVAELQEHECLALVRARLAQGAQPLDLLGACLEGLRLVGERFAQGRYYMAALIMGGEIMREATDLLKPCLDAAGSTAPSRGTALVATVKGDVHDLGKNLFSLLLECHGFEVDDLGVDVDAAAVVARAAEKKPDVVGLSCILTSSVQNLRDTVSLLRTSPGAPRPPVIIGGCAVDVHVQEFVQADLWAADAARGAELCRGVVLGRGNE